MTERTYTQPHALAANMMKMQAETIRSAAEAASPIDYARRMEAAGPYVRLDTGEDAIVNRGATISLPELGALREIENVVRKGHVRSISHTALTLEEGETSTTPGRIYVDCTASGLSSAPAVPIFEETKINMHFTTLGVAPWSAAVIGFVESLSMPIEEKNALCPALPRTGDLNGILNIMRIGLPAERARRAVGEFADWSARARLNPGRSISDHMDNPNVQAAFGVMMQAFVPAMRNLERLCADHPVSP